MAIFLLNRMLPSENNFRCIHSFLVVSISWKVLHPLASGFLLLAQWAASNDSTYMAWLTGPKKFSAAIEFLFSRQFLG
jgi:hypothetical protein